MNTATVCAMSMVCFCLEVFGQNPARSSQHPLGPLVSTQGDFAGLFLDDGGVTLHHSGSFQRTVTSRGNFTAKLRFSSKVYSLHGRFTDSGTYSNAIPRRGLSPLSVQLQLDQAEGDRMIGSISDGSFFSSLTANRATYSKKSNP